MAEPESVAHDAEFADVRLKPLPGAKSKVWKFFGFATNENGTIADKKRVNCTLCKKPIQFSGNTTNLSYHLQHNHPEQYDKICTEKQGAGKVSKGKTVINQSTLTACSTRQTPYKRSSQRYLTCEDALVEFICKDFQPISVVESPSFLKYTKTLDPQYQPASRTHFTRVAIPKKYEEVKGIVQRSLATAEHVSFTTDLWTGCHQRAYLSLTVHYINPAMEIVHHSLCTREVSDAHTAENLAKELEESLREWAIRDKVYGATTDNGMNIKNAIVNEMELQHFPCIGHTLQLSVAKALHLTPVLRLLWRVKKLIEHFRKSTKATYALREKQVLLNIPQHELVQQCDTRWNSTLHMLQ